MSSSRFRQGLSPPRRGGRGPGGVAARNAAKPALDEEAMEEIKEAFNLFDTEGKDTTCMAAGTGTSASKNTANIYLSFNIFSKSFR
jgi:hypothetical protein